MNKLFKLTAILILVSSAGCGDQGKQDEAVETEKPKSHVFDTQKEALDKAKQVEQTLMDAAERQRQQIDDDSK